MQPQANQNVAQSHQQIKSRTKEETKKKQTLLEEDVYSKRRTERQRVVVQKGVKGKQGRFE